jgi:hypothetical protein
MTLMEAGTPAFGVARGERMQLDRLKRRELITLLFIYANTAIKCESSKPIDVGTSIKCELNYED